MSDPHPSNHFTQYAMGKDMGTSLESLSLHKGSCFFHASQTLRFQSCGGWI